MTLATATRLGPYEIIEPIGAGGMGEVYRARDTRLGREVAIKVCTEEFARRFEREAHAIAQLNHPHICTLDDVGSNYLVMELVEGETLARAGRRAPFRWSKWCVSAFKSPTPSQPLMPKESCIATSSREM